ncbi:DUF3558 domain-containing protein [Nocardia thailandica]|uniref:DUF3558 domain-containing protein n=1 Tax=Nocardia thailandica TaxID=257275 RepID=A0ABW6PM14_9NOCA
MIGRRAAAALGCAGLLIGVATGCGRTVPGNPQPVGSGQQVNVKFDKLLRECEVVSAQQIEDAVGEGTSPEFSFFGAVCMWDLIGAPGGDGMATLAWYENGNLRNERSTYDKLKYTTENITVQGTLALQIRRPNDGDSCGVSAAAADTGVISWWINYRPGSGHPNPCDAAKKLVELTLNLAR